MSLLPKHFNWRIIAYALRDAWPAWMLLAGIALAGLLGTLCARSSPEASRAADAVRFAGTALEVFGLLLVVYGISSMRKLFGRPSLWATTRSWLGRWAAAFRGPHVIHGAGITAGGAQMSGHGKVSFKASRDSTVERRLDVLEQALEDFRVEVEADHKNIMGSIAATNQSLEKEARERRDDHRKTKALLEGAAVGDVHLEFVGAVWLLLGVLGANLPAELARLFS